MTQRHRFLAPVIFLMAIAIVSLAACGATLTATPMPTAAIIVTSNKPFTAWGEIFGDPVVAAAMIDRLVHHAEIINMKGESYRLKDKQLTRLTEQSSGAKSVQST